ncbi:glycosyltransferase [Cryobacterium sp. N22]|uniref:glycosyltransferase n=1 Tax=Cryobacterium sp. N22 TaxID=2048290 RepID=UPI000CE2E307|nr:glycosyltransferase [Cryobacterium sp. N22]
MKFLIDTLGAPSLSGGMRLYAEELINSWSEAFPHDELVVVGGAWTRGALQDLPNVRVVVWANDSAPLRMVGQLVVSGVLFWAFRANVLVSVSSIASPLAPRARRVCVVHDWRHMRNEREFGALQRAYRRLWTMSLNRAGATVSISAKTDAETAEYAPRAHRFIVENGRDHARRWVPALAGRGKAEFKRIVTFGHHLNKRPDLVIQALAEMPPLARPQLTVLGARGATKETLEKLSRELGVATSCNFPGFVESDEYNSLIQTADAVVLASSDEGFGLPVAEAQYFGIPVVSTSDSGLDEIHAGLFVSEPDPANLAVAIQLAVQSRGATPAAVVGGTWAETASGIRRIAVRA